MKRASFLCIFGLVLLMAGSAAADRIVSTFHKSYTGLVVINQNPKPHRRYFLQFSKRQSVFLGYNQLIDPDFVGFLNQSCWHNKKVTINGMFDKWASGVISLNRSSPFTYSNP